MVTFRQIRRSQGFTLLEVLLVFALGLLVVGAVVFSLDNLVRAFSEKPWESLFYESIQQARYQAVSQQAPCQMVLSPDSSHWVLTAADSKEEFPSGLPEETTATYFPIEAVDDYRNTPEAPASQEGLSALVVYPTGLMTPVDVHISLPGRTPAIIRPDPCSSGPQVIHHED